VRRLSINYEGFKAGEDMMEQEITVTIKDGLHARPAADLVKKLGTVSSAVQLYSGQKEYNPKSIISLMSGTIKEGETIRVVVTGSDEEETMAWLNDFFAGKTS